MASFRRGDKEAAGQLMELFYPELRRLAAAKMRGERAEHTWQPTVLVNELYLQLLKMKALGTAETCNEEDKTAFFALAAHLMKRLLVDHARPLYRRVERVEIQEGPDLHVPSADSLQLIESLLSRLAAINPRFRTVVEMKVFEGATEDEIGARLGCATISVTRYWRFARQWLKEQLVE